jgi:hypothetical protein
MSFRKKCKTLKALQGATAYCSELFSFMQNFIEFQPFSRNILKDPMKGSR